MPVLSVVIPTYSRCNSLQRLLSSLSHQSLSRHQYEVVVVDDGSTDRTSAVCLGHYPFHLHYRHQAQAGATAARNAGARLSQGTVLVFLDDDVVPTPNMLVHLLDAICAMERTIVLATLVHVPEAGFAIACPNHHAPGRLGQVSRGRPWEAKEELRGEFVHFTHCLTGALAVDRDDFFSLGLFQDPTGGWPNWDDVDFGYRAHKAGYRFWRSSRAIAYHCDHALASLGVRCRRLQRASAAAPRLFRRHPGLRQHLSMFHDKGPIILEEDTIGLIVNKLFHSAWAGRIPLRAMECLWRIFGKSRPDSLPLQLLQRWIESAYVLKGYREGLNELGRELGCRRPRH